MRQGLPLVNRLKRVRRLRDCIDLLIDLRAARAISGSKGGKAAASRLADSRDARRLPRLSALDCGRFDAAALRSAATRELSRRICEVAEGFLFVPRVGDVGRVARRILTTLRCLVRLEPFSFGEFAAVMEKKLASAADSGEGWTFLGTAAGIAVMVSGRLRTLAAAIGAELHDEDSAAWNFALNLTMLGGKVLREGLGYLKAGVDSSGDEFARPNSVFFLLEAVGRVESAIKGFTVGVRSAGGSRADFWPAVRATLQSAGQAAMTDAEALRISAVRRHCEAVLRQTASPPFEADVAVMAKRLLCSGGQVGSWRVSGRLVELRSESEVIRFFATSETETLLWAAGHLELIAARLSPPLAAIVQSALYQLFEAWLRGFAALGSAPQIVERWLTLDLLRRLALAMETRTSLPDSARNAALVSRFAAGVKESREALETVMAEQLGGAFQAYRHLLEEDFSPSRTLPSADSQSPSPGLFVAPTPHLSALASAIEAAIARLRSVEDAELRGSVFRGVVERVEEIVDEVLRPQARLFKHQAAVNCEIELVKSLIDKFRE